jgi:hypothetical protein
MIKELMKFQENPSSEVLSKNKTILIMLKQEMKASTLKF